MSDQERLAGYVDVWWQAINDFTRPARGACPRRSGHADRPRRLGREGGRLPHRPPRGHPRRRARGDRRRRRAAARHRADGPLHRDRGGQPARRQPGRDHQRDPRPRRPPGTPRCSPTRRPTRRASPTPIFGGVPWNWRTLLRNRPLDVWMHEQDVRRAVGRPGGMDTVAGAAHRRVPRREPRLRARQEGRRTGRHHRWCSRWRAARRSRSRSTTPAAASGSPEPPADPTVTLRMDRETLHPARRRPLRRRARRGHGRGRPGARRSGSSTRMATTP